MQQEIQFLDEIVQKWGHTSMKKKYKIIVIAVIGAILIGSTSAFCVYEMMLQKTKITDKDFYGTYQLQPKNFEAGYLAINPRVSSEKSDGQGEFQWYDVEGTIVAKGSCKREESYMVLEADGKNIATLFLHSKKYYFIDSSLEPKEIVKISEEAIVAVP